MNSADATESAFSLELSVFPLTGTILFPRTLMPLNIFEPRYLSMVHDAIERHGSIAISPRDPRDHAEDAPMIVGYGRPEVVHRRPDGTLVILLIGEGKARLGKLVSETPYLSFRAEPLEEVTEVIQPNRFPLNRLRKLYASWLEESLPDEKHGAGEPAEPQRLLEAISMHLVHTAEAQQQVLEMNNVNERIEFLRQLLLEKN